MSTKLDRLKQTNHLLSTEAPADLLLAKREAMGKYLHMSVWINNNKILFTSRLSSLMLQTGSMTCSTAEHISWNIWKPMKWNKKKNVKASCLLAVLNEGVPRGVKETGCVRLPRCEHLDDLHKRRPSLYIHVKNLNLLSFMKPFRAQSLSHRHQFVALPVAQWMDDWMNRSCMGNSVNARLNPSAALKKLRQRLRERRANGAAGYTPGTFFSSIMLFVNNMH